MLWVHEKKNQPGRWEVAWTWMPYFLAADTDLVKQVDQGMTELFAHKQTTPLEMHQAVVALIVQKYPIKGLAKWLYEGVQEVLPEEAA